MIIQASPCFYVVEITKLVLLLSDNCQRTYLERHELRSHRLVLPSRRARMNWQRGRIRSSFLEEFGEQVGIRSIIFGLLNQGIEDLKELRPSVIGFSHQKKKARTHLLVGIRIRRTCFLFFSESFNSSRFFSSCDVVRLAF